MDRLRQNMSIVLIFYRRAAGRREPGAGHRGGDLAVYLAVRLLSETAALAQSVAIGWSVYTRSGVPLALGWVGLAQFVPMALLMLPAGELCDRGQPRHLFAAGLALQGICASGFLVLASMPAAPLWFFYPTLVLSGAARAVSEPAGQALLPFLVPAKRLPQAIAWSSSLWQLAVIAGPALGGLAYALGPAGAYGFCGVSFLAATLGAAALRGRRPAPVDLSVLAGLAGRIARVTEGIRFVRAHPILLGAISLDLVAVLLGGATALLPVYARDVLHAGSIGLGLLRAAPAVGACAVALYQARHPPRRHVGLELFASVAVFGLATVVFALSTALWASLASLLIVGASDMVSVNLRSSLVQLTTPDALRGRVAAVNMLFVGTSSELGAFESGLLASLIGVVPAVVLGGAGALAAAVAWMALFPALRRADRLTPAEHPRRPSE